MIIYKLENKVNGKVYIGQTRGKLNYRVACHLRAGTLIGCALRKYGIESFSISTIGTAESREVLNEQERYWIRTMQCKSPGGYNLASGGEVHDAPMSEESKENLRRINTGKKFSEEHKRRISESHKGVKRKPFTEETRKRMSEANKGSNNPMYGRTLSAETMQKMLTARRAKKLSAY